jgi:hypothetical protein
MNNVISGAARRRHKAAPIPLAAPVTRIVRFRFSFCGFNLAISLRQVVAKCRNPVVTAVTLFLPEFCYFSIADGALKYHLALQQ